MFGYGILLTLSLAIIMGMGAWDTMVEGWRFKGPTSTVRPKTPPTLAKLLIAVVVTTKHRDALLGDLHEKFVAAIERGWSKSRARRMYWSETLRTIVPLAVERFKSIAAVALVRRFFG
jgi:hypothetical protein